MSKLDLPTSQAILRGEFVPFSEANVSIASSANLYGLTVYTVFSANWNEEKQQLYLFRLRDHYERLVRACRIMDFADFTAMYSFEAFAELMLELVRKNDVKEDALIRVMIFVDEIAAGTKINGLKNSLAAFVYPMGEILALDGVHACVSSWNRNADNMIPPRAKLNGSYINAALMKNEALRNGYDEAIALDQQGHVAEGTVANLFLVRNGKLVTPHAQSDILEGITRNTILHLAEQLKIKLEERDIDRTELYIADEAMFVGSSARITPVLSIDKRPIGSGQIGTVTKLLSHAYKQLQYGESTNESGWLTSVYP